MVKYYENPSRKGFKNNKWKAIKSPEGGTPTIAYGHKLTKKEYYSGKLYNGLNWKKGISESDAIDLLYRDLYVNYKKAEDVFYYFPTYPKYLKQALINACYRGEVKTNKKWVQMVNLNDWYNAHKEYLNNKEYKRSKIRYSGPGGLADRMEWNAEQFVFYAFEY